MAYVGYPQINYQQPNYMQVPQQYVAPYQQLQPQPQQSNNIIWVQGEAGAKSYLVAPNNTVQLWDSEAQVIYLKSADASGMPTIKVLRYTIDEQSTQNNPIQNVNQQQGVNQQVVEDKPEYVTRAEMEEFGNKLMEQMYENSRQRHYYKHNRKDGNNSESDKGE